MSFASAVLDLNPYFYFSMEQKINYFPVDIISDEEAIIYGDYEFEAASKGLSDSLNIFDNTYFQIPGSADFESSPATFGMWISSDFAEDEIDIFSIHSNSDGIGISYSITNSEITIHNYNGVNFTESFDFPDNAFLTVQIEPEIGFGVDPDSNSIVFKINSEVIHSQAGFFIPDFPDIVLGSLQNGEARGQITVSDLFYLQSTISQYNIENLYSLGLNGYEIFPFDSSSSITFNDSSNTYLQTAWQAYGEITTKK